MPASERQSLYHCGGDLKSAAESSSKPIAVILGTTYELSHSHVSHDMLDRVSKVVFLTYRKGFRIELPTHYSVERAFPWIPKLGISSVVTSDKHWGCAVRSTQMALAESLQALAARNPTPELERAAIVRMFHDSIDEPFSIHNFVKADIELGACVSPLKFGCASSALCASYAINAQTRVDLASTAFTDGVLYIKEVERAFQRKRSVVIWITIQKHMNNQEKECVRRLFAEPWIKGIIGAERSAHRAYYIVGYDSESLLFLDPHVACTHKLGALSHPSELQTRKLHRLRWDRLGDAMTLCLLFQEEAEFGTFLRAATSSHLQWLPFEIVAACAPQLDFD